MRKLFLVFKHEYTRRVKTRGFVFSVVSIPIILIFAILLGIISVRMQSNPLPVGLVDKGSVFKNAAFEADYSDMIAPPVEIVRFIDEENGIVTLEKGGIQALFIISEGYLESGLIEVKAINPPGDNAYARMNRFIQTHLANENRSEYIARINEGSDFIIQSLDGSRKTNRQDWFVVLFPFMVGLIFVVVINISGGYLVQSVVDEKANRTMEMIVTSVSSKALMGGKILGNLCVGLSQLIIWLFFVVIGVIGIEFLFGFGYVPTIQGVHYIMFFGIFIPGFILIAGLMTIVAVSATSLREAQQISMLFTLPMVSPYWFAGAVFENPSHPLSKIMSLFPLTAVVTMPLRVAVEIVPAWQLVLVSALTWTSAIGALLLAAKVFRMGMLRFGKRLSIKEWVGRRSQDAHA